MFYIPHLKRPEIKPWCYVIKINYNKSQNITSLGVLSNLYLNINDNVLLETTNTY